MTDIEQPNKIYEPVKRIRPGPKKQIYTLTRSFRVSPSMSNRIDEICNERNIHPSVFLRKAISRFMKHIEDHPDDIPNME